MNPEPAQRLPLWLLLGAGFLMELCFLSFYAVRSGPGEVLLFIAVNVATFLIASFLLLLLRRSAQPAPRIWLIPVMALGVLFRLTLVPHAVVGSDDIYRYIWDGKVAAAGINPFAYTPTDPHLAQLATVDLPAKVNHPELRSVYPALAQLLFMASHALFGDSVWGMKLLLVIMDSLTMMLLWLFVRERPDPVFPVLLYAWSPLPVLYFGLDGHIDALGIPFLILGIWYFSTLRPVKGALALGMSALSKLIPLVLLPLLLRHLKGYRRLVIPAIPLLMVLAGALIYYEPTWGVVQSLTTFGSRWEFNGGVFSIVYFLTDSNQAAHIVSGILILLSIGFLGIINRPLLEKIFWGFVVFILLSPVVHPWYLTWLAALVALRWSPGVYVFLGMSALANVIVYQYRSAGLWNDSPLLLLVEYLPVFILLTREAVRGDVLRAQSGA